MKFNLFTAIRNTIKNVKKGNKYDAHKFTTSEVPVPKNNLELGQLKVVYSKKDNNIKNNTQQTTSPPQINVSRNFDKDKFMHDIIQWGKELDMSDEEYNMYQKRKSLSSRMEVSNIRVLDK